MVLAQVEAPGLPPTERTRASPNAARYPREAAHLAGLEDGGSRLAEHIGEGVGSRETPLAPDVPFLLPLPLAQTFHTPYRLR